MNHVFFSPAKVNLFLKILSKRADGYHNLFSLVDLISLYDVIKIEEITGDTIVVEDDKDVLPKGEGNTLFRAAKAIKDHYSIKKGVHIYIEKHIPIGSGLGGPSSNAATVLKALTQIWDVHPADTELTKVGAAIGADVPLFLYGKPCTMEGIGDIISPIQLPPLWYVVVYPEYILSTKEAYSRLKIVLTNNQKHTRLMGNFINIDDITGRLENDLEQVGITMCPKIRIIKDRLMDSGAMGSLMSGSGSSVFGIFRNANDMEESARLFRNFGRVFTAHSHREG